MREWLGDSFDSSVSVAGGGSLFGFGFGGASSTATGKKKRGGRRRNGGKKTKSGRQQWQEQYYRHAGGGSSASGAATVAGDGSDGNNRPQQQQQQQQLDWSLDPRHSDWTIEIICKEDDTSTKYQVHKIILAVGPWKCDYFERLLEKEEAAKKKRNRNNDDASSTAASSSRTAANNTVVRVKLHKLAADAFPRMLDYVYGAPTSPLNITTQTATGLHCLGICFENKWLTWEAKQFWKKDLSLENCHVYYVHAQILQDEHVLMALVELLAKNVQWIASDAPILKVATPEFWIDVFDKAVALESAGGELGGECDERCDPVLNYPLVDKEARDDDDNSDVNSDDDDNSNKRRQQFFASAVLKNNGGGGGNNYKNSNSINNNGHNLKKIPGTLIASVLEHQKALLTDETLDRLTSEEFLGGGRDGNGIFASGGIDPDVALRILKVDQVVDRLTPLQERCLTNVPGRVVAEICEVSCDMTPHMFEVVTSDKYLPAQNIDPDLACRLLRLEPKYVVVPDDKLTSLQKRCLASYCDNWELLSNHGEIIDSLSRQNPLFLAEILKGTANKLQTLQQKLETTQTVLNKHLLRERVMKRDYEAEIERLNDMVCSSILGVKGD